MPIARRKDAGGKSPDVVCLVPNGSSYRWYFVGVRWIQRTQLLRLFTQARRHGDKIESSKECGRQEKCEALSDGQRVFGPPGLRFVTKQAKFPGRLFAAALDIAIDA